MAATRIVSIDAVRGFCLVNIFINHVTLGALLEISPSKIAFCDSAEIFVLLAGISTFLAYAGPGERPGEAPEWRRMWHRALILYFVNLLIVAASFAILSIGAPPTAPHDPPAALIAQAGPANYFWHVVTMQQSIGFSMVLRLYVVLMLVAPAYVWLAGKRFWYPLAAAGAVWAVSGHFGLAGRDSLTGQLLSMNILNWQLVFAAGISLGAAIVQGLKMPRSPMLISGAVLIVAGGTLLLALGDRLSPSLFAWLELRNEFFWTGISKSYQSPLRLLYLAALVYLVIALPRAPVIRLLHQARPTTFFCRLGRRSLPVFAFGAVFALAVDQLLWNMISAGWVIQRSAGALAVELALVGIGLWLMKKIAEDTARIRPPSLFSHVRRMRLPAR